MTDLGKKFGGTTLVANILRKFYHLFEIVSFGSVIKFKYVNIIVCGSIPAKSIFLF